MVKEFKRHPLSAVWGDMTPEEFIAMEDSVSRDGVVDPVVIWQGMVLDGWQRYSVARALGQDCPLEYLTLSSDEAREFVIRRGTRRSLTMSQRAMAIVACHEWSPRGGQSAVAADSKTGAQLAEAAGTSVRTVEAAKTVLRRAIPEVIRAAKDGDVSVHRAAEVAQLPKGEQKDALAAPPAPRPTTATPRPAPAPGQAKAWKPAGPLPRPTTGPSQEAFDELKEKLQILVEANDALSDRLAVAAIEGPYTPDERAAYGLLLTELRAELRTLRAELEGARATRDSLMTENNELKQQIKLDQRRGNKS